MEHALLIQVSSPDLLPQKPNWGVFEFNLEDIAEIHPSSRRLSADFASKIYRETRPTFLEDDWGRGNIRQFELVLKDGREIRCSSAMQALRGKSPFQLC